MISCSAVEFTSVTSKPGKEKGSECNKKLLMKTYILSAFPYEPESQWLSTTSAGEPLYQVLDSLRRTFLHLTGQLFHCPRDHPYLF